MINGRLGGHITSAFLAERSRQMLTAFTYAHPLIGKAFIHPRDKVNMRLYDIG